MTAHTLSSTAERAYWLGRYLERSETTARLIAVHANLLMDLPKRIPLGWRPLVEITGNLTLFGELFGEVTERTVCRFLINDPRHSGSLLSSLSWARENARTLRGIIPKHAFEYVNEMHLEARDGLSEPLSRSRRFEGLSRIGEHVQRIDGFMSANMMHDAHWRFLRIGQFIERADMTTRVIDVATGSAWQSATGLEVFADIQWRSVLRSLYAQHSYNTSVGEPITQGPVIHFLLNHRGLPRSVAYGLNSVRNSLRGLPRNELPMRAVNRMLRQLGQTAVQGLGGAELSAYLDQCQIGLSEIHDAVRQTYFDFRPRQRRASGAGPARTTRTG
ncbi:MAG: alpha-E domain-containing protein [Pseudomonadales bacterium]|nr:alpha-E domain-containing protein [Pseudomonadales bacterium]